MTANEADPYAEARRELDAAHPITPDSVLIVLHTWQKSFDGRCFRCGGPYDGDVQVHLVLGETSPAFETALCGDCVESGLGDYGRALVRLRDALEDMDKALATVPDAQLHRLSAYAIKAVEMMTDAYWAAERDRFIGVQPTPAGGDL